jgi:type II secretory pathway component PulM
VADAARAKLSWMVVVASLLLLALLLYLMFANYLPAKQRIANLELELKELYGREAALQTRIQELERELAAARSR